MNDSTGKVIPALDTAGAGEAQAGEKLLPLVYDELRRLAAARMAREAPGQALQATAPMTLARRVVLGIKHPIADRRIDRRHRTVSHCYT